MIKVAIYARASTEMQAEDEIPILGQIQGCQSVLQRQGIDVICTNEPEFEGSCLLLNVYRPQELQPFLQPYGLASGNTSHHY